MDNKEIIEMYIKKLETESNYRKFLDINFIKSLIDFFKNNSYKKLLYPKEFDNYIKIALQFYKDYNSDYYNIIEEAIKKERIIFDNGVEKSYTDAVSHATYIKLYGNDGDLFLIVHELAHYVSLNTKPPIIPDNYDFLAEVFSLYIEKVFELWLNDKKHEDLIARRKNNRLYFEANMMKAIELQLKYEEMFLSNGFLSKAEISIDEIKFIMRFNEPNLINYLLRYPLGNILSDYLLGHHLLKSNSNFCEVCLQTDLHVVLAEFISKNQISLD